VSTLSTPAILRCFWRSTIPSRHKFASNPYHFKSSRRRRSRQAPLNRQPPQGRIVACGGGAGGLLTKGRVCEANRPPFAIIK
jgi:hypothetical protein